MHLNKSFKKIQAWVRPFPTPSWQCLNFGNLWDGNPSLRAKKFPHSPCILVFSHSHIAEDKDEHQPCFCSTGHYKWAAAALAIICLPGLAIMIGLVSFFQQTLFLYFYLSDFGGTKAKPKSKPVQVFLSISRCSCVSYHHSQDVRKCGQRTSCTFSGCLRRKVVTSSA